MDIPEVTEVIKAIHNRCHIYMEAKESAMAEHVLPTVLEDLHEDSQKIIDEFCTVKDD